MAVVESTPPDMGQKPYHTPSEQSQQGSNLFRQDPCTGFPGRRANPHALPNQESQGTSQKVRLKGNLTQEKRYEE